jgi:hypothetical protein
VDAVVVRGHHDARHGAALGGALEDVEDHRLPGEVGKRLAREAGAGVARGDDGGGRFFTNSILIYEQRSN